MEWIKIEDRLPKVNIEDGDFKTSEKVIAFFRSGKEYWCESVTLKLWYEDDKAEWYYDYDNERVKDNKITHWMPLPKLPKK